MLIDQIQKCQVIKLGLTLGPQNYWLKKDILAPPCGSLWKDTV